MTVELRHLRTFVVLAEELHFGRAAARLHVVQSTVSQTLSALEDALGFTLVLRTRRHVVLSLAGERYLEHARAALAAVERARIEAHRAAEGEWGTLRIQLIATGALTVLPRAIARFRREHPDVTIEIDQAGSAQQVEALRAERCDLGFIASVAEIGVLRSARLTQESLVALVSREHRWARRRRLRPQELVDEPLIMMSRRTEPELFAIYRELCARHGAEPRIVLECDQLSSMLAFVAASIGVSCAPEAVTQLRHRGVVAIPIVPRMDSGIRVVWNGDALPVVGERFLKVLWEEQAAAQKP